LGIFTKFLADRTAVRSMVGCWHDIIVCPSVCVTLYMLLQVS